MRCCFDNEEIVLEASTVDEAVKRMGMTSATFRRGFMSPDGLSLRERVLVVVDGELYDDAAEPPIPVEADSIVTFMHQLAGG